MINLEYLERLKEHLYSEREKAQHLEFKEVSIGSWSPQPNQCHKNAMHYAKHTDDHLVVFGWLLMDYSFEEYIRLNFIAHTVVRHKDGDPFDITPRHSGMYKELKFLKASIPLHEYDYLISNDIGDFRIERKLSI